MSLVKTDARHFSATMIAYFDTNIFDHIHKRIGFTDSDLSALRSAVKAGKIKILLSVLNLEETSAALDSCPDVAIAELQLILELADWQRFVKPTNMLLSDDIGCYARGVSVIPPFITDPVLWSNLEKLRNASQKDAADFWADLKDKTQKQKEDFMRAMREGKEKIALHVEKFNRSCKSFNEYWEILAEKFAEALAERVGVLEACKTRGIKGMLEIRSVRLCAGVGLSLTYAQDVEGRVPKIGDSRDQQHAVLSAAANMFVTHDGKLAELVARVPTDDFEVLDLPGLLDRIS